MKAEDKVMTELQVFDPALCCSSGVCGPEPDPTLAHFAADLEWLRGRGVSVRRFNLSHEPTAFAENQVVRDALVRSGTDCLPLLLVGGRVVAHGRYPSRDEMKGWNGTGRTDGTDDRAPAGRSTLGGPSGSCDPSSGCC